MSTWSIFYMVYTQQSQCTVPQAESHSVNCHIIGFPELVRPKASLKSTLHEAHKEYITWLVLKNC
jgi:hypothetical protein